MLAEESRRIVEILIEEIEELAAVYRFGSTARGAGREGSDVDIALLAPELLDPAKHFSLQEDLAAALRKDVDLIDLRAAPTVLRMQVVSRGTVIADLNPQARSSFETYVFADYARLNEERREILERVAREGRVYAG